MIRIRKGPVPATLARNAKKWTDEYLRYVGDGTDAPESLVSKYKCTEVKDAILEETHGKCAYCESKIRHVYPGDVEHILPRSRKPELIFDWLNLTLSCSVCNNHKHDYYDEHDPLVHPVNDEPSEHLTFFGPMCIHMPGQRKGQLTRDLLHLNRPELIERRYEAIERLLPLLDDYASEFQPRLKQLIGDQLIKLTDEQQEYSLMLKALLRASGIEPE